MIGGSPALADSPFMEAARSALRDYNTESLGIHLRLRMGQLPERQYALGGCYLVFDHMFSRPKLALTAVSYTHLDVYKRQAIRSVCAPHGPSCR